MPNSNIYVADAPQSDDDPPSISGALSAESFSFSSRVAAVSAALGLCLCDLSNHDRRRLIAALFDPRVAPAAVELAA